MTRATKKIKPMSDRDVIAEAIHTNGDCGYDGGTWDEMQRSGYQCGCFGLASRIARALNKRKRLRGGRI